MRKQRGFSLIELVIFIVVIGIIASGILVSYSTVLRGVPRANYQSSAMGYAINCLEWFLGQHHLNKFSDINVGTAVPNFCSYKLPSGYNISTTVSNTTYRNDSNYKIINAKVTSPRDLGYANISVIIANY